MTTKNDEKNEAPEEAKAEAQVFWDKLLQECGDKPQALRMMGALFRGMPYLLTELFLQEPQVIDLLDEPETSSRILHGWNYVVSLGSIVWRRKAGNPYGIMWPGRSGALIEENPTAQSPKVFSAKILPWSPPSEDPSTAEFINDKGEGQNEPFYFQTDAGAKAAVDLAFSKSNRGWILKGLRSTPSGGS